MGYIILSGKEKQNSWIFIKIFSNSASIFKKTVLDR